MTRGEAIPGAIRLLFEVGTVAGMSDGQLLDRFLDRRRDEEAAEIAFAALVERHGPMVLRACRSRLGDEHDAQDAFQATFLILARKAGSIRQHESAASWLHGVARRVASCARRAASVRRAKERLAAGGKLDHVTEADGSDLVPAVREEVGDLPEKYRAPLMLCLLDGLTHEEAADRLGWPVGTVKTRVRRAKDQLRVRLTRRGLAPSLAAIAAALSARTASAMPASVVRTTARAALGFEMGRDTALLSASVARLVELAMGSLIMSRLKLIGVVITTVGVLVAGAATGVARQGPGPQAVPKPVAAEKDVRDVAASQPVAAVVANEATSNQVEMDRLRLEIRREEFDWLKKAIIQEIKSAGDREAKLKDLRSARNLEELRKFVPYQTDKGFEAEKKEKEDWMSGLVEQNKESLKQSLTHYSLAKRELAREEERVKALDAQTPRDGLARQGSATPEAPRPADAQSGVGDVADEGTLDQLDLARIDLQMHVEQAESLKNQIVQKERQIIVFQDHIETARTARSVSPLRQFSGLVEIDDTLETARKRIEDFYRDAIKENDESLKNLRLAYSEIRRRVRRDEQRIKDLEARTARVAPIGSTAIARVPADDDQIEAARLDIQLLGSEVNALNTQVQVAIQTCLRADESVRRYTLTPMPAGLGDAGPAAPDPVPVPARVLEEGREKAQKFRDYTRKHLEEIRAEYLAKARDLRREEQRLKNLESSKGDPRTTDAPLGDSPGSKPAEVDRRLSDVERKLDLILKALEKPGGKR